MLVEYLAGGEHGSVARSRLLGDPEPLWAPHLVDAEVGHVLRRAVHDGELRASVAGAALDDLADMPLTRAGHVGLLGRAWALRANLTFYDALYVALAERLGMPFVTFDARVARASGVQAAVEVLV